MECARWDEATMHEARSTKHEAGNVEETKSNSQHRERRAGHVCLGKSPWSPASVLFTCANRLLTQMRSSDEGKRQGWGLQHAQQGKVQGGLGRFNVGALSSEDQPARL